MRQLKVSLIQKRSTFSFQTKKIKLNKKNKTRLFHVKNAKKRRDRNTGKGVKKGAKKRREARRYPPNYPTYNRDRVFLWEFLVHKIPAKRGHMFTQKSLYYERDLGNCLSRLAGSCECTYVESVV